MKLHVTDGTSKITVHFDPILDFEQVEKINNSKRPVSQALRFAKKRLEVESGLWPIQGLALEGLEKEVA